MSAGGVSDDEVYASAEYQQYLVIFEDYAAFFYAREELVAARERQSLLAAPDEPLTYREAHRQYLLTPEWRERADAAKARFGGRCALCNAVGPLEAHHRTYERHRHELPEDLTALCADCHGAYHLWRRGGLAHG